MPSDMYGKRLALIANSVATFRDHFVPAIIFDFRMPGKSPRCPQLWTVGLQNAASMLSYALLQASVLMRRVCVSFSVAQQLYVRKFSLRVRFLLWPWIEPAAIRVQAECITAHARLWLSAKAFCFPMRTL